MIITQEIAINLARKYLKQLPDAEQYKIVSPTVTMEDKEYYVEFHNKSSNIKPGACIIAVDKDTGDIRIEPVE